MGARPQRRFFFFADSERQRAATRLRNSTSKFRKKSLFPSRKRYGCIDFGDSAEARRARRASLAPSTTTRSSPLTI